MPISTLREDPYSAILLKAAAAARGRQGVYGEWDKRRAMQRLRAKQTTAHGWVCEMRRGMGGAMCCRRGRERGSFNVWGAPVLAWRARDDEAATPRHTRWRCRLQYIGSRAALSHAAELNVHVIMQLPILI